MSLHISVVSAEGDRLEELAGVITAIQYRIEKSFHVHTGDAASVELDWNPDRNVVAKVAYEADGYTHIIDPELVLMSDDIWLKYSARWKCRVIGWVIEGASGSYGLTVFDSGQKVREVLACGGEVAVNSGEPLDEEMNMVWAEANEDDVLAVAERLGSEYDLSDRDYLVLHLDESQIVLPGQ
jgi:hypothetical protein